MKELREKEEEMLIIASSVIFCVILGIAFAIYCIM